MTAVKTKPNPVPDIPGVPASVLTGFGPALEEAVQRRWTYDELLDAIPETNQPHELWDGELIWMATPTPTHQEIVDRLHDALKTWVRARKLGRTFIAPLDMVLSPHQSHQPDVMFIALERSAIIQDRIRGPVDLAMEVISPGSRRRDRIDKRDVYQQHGIREYWLVDPEAGTVEVLFLNGPEYTMTGRWRAGEAAESRLLPGFKVEVEPLFNGEA